ncbi:MAG: leucine-rich repeat protein [Eubacteriales bacterium]|nr:leucine-rich repeat protein [Eubacteriales bacterium]
MTGTVTGCDRGVYSADIPSSISGVPVTKIKKYTFFFKGSLTSVTLPDTIEEIGNYAFSYSAITSITIPASVDKLSDHAFNDCKSLKTVELPDTLKEIPKYCFSSCENLRSITIPDSVKQIGSGAFGNCKYLEKAEIGNGVKVIGQSAFEFCNRLETVTFGSGIQNIDSFAFNYCEMLETLYFKGDAPTIDSSAFSGTSNIMVYYPENASGWTTPAWNGLAVQPMKSSGDSSANDPKDDTTPAPDPDQLMPAPTPVPEQPSTPPPAITTAKPTASSVLVNGISISFDAYNINDNNYFKLRDVGQLFNFGVTRDGNKNQITIYDVLMYTKDLIEPTIFGLYGSLQPAVSYNYGRGNWKRTKVIEKWCFGANVVGRAIATAFVFLMFFLKILKEKSLSYIYSKNSSPP